MKPRGPWDKKAWDEVGKKFGPAARVGDLVQITKLTIENDKLVLEINGGMKGGRKWYEGDSDWHGEGGGVDRAHRQR